MAELYSFVFFVNRSKIYFVKPLYYEVFEKIKKSSSNFSKINSY